MLGGDCGTPQAPIAPRPPVRPALPACRPVWLPSHRLPRQAATSAPRRSRIPFALADGAGRHGGRTTAVLQQVGERRDRGQGQRLLDCDHVDPASPSACRRTDARQARGRRRACRRRSRPGRSRRAPPRSPPPRCLPPSRCAVRCLRPRTRSRTRFASPSPVPEGRWAPRGCRPASGGSRPRGDDPSADRDTAEARRSGTRRNADAAR